MLLRFMTYNIRDGGTGRLQQIIEVIKAVEPDILLLQELTKLDTLEHLANVLDMCFCFAQGNSRYYLGLLSRFPIIFYNSYHPFPLRHALLEAKVKHLGQDIYLFGVHLVAHPLVFCEWWRAWEIDIILRRILPYLSEFCLLAGDFNAISPGDMVRWKEFPLLLKIVLLLQADQIFRNVIPKITALGFVDCYRTLHPDNAGFTLPPPSPHIRLDYIFANRSLAPYLKTCEVVTWPFTVHEASDHYPLTAVFDL